MTLLEPTKQTPNLKTEKDFSDYLHDAIKKNFLLVILITSQTQGKRKSANLPFGLGKSTLAFWLSYYLNGKDWNKVFEYLCGNPYDVVGLLEPGRERVRAALWDAVQMTAPAEQGVPRVIRKMSSYISDTRPELACLIMTASNMNAICAPLRKLVVFEVIIAERGEYEIQKIKYHKNYKQPLMDLSNLEYLEEGTFPALPKEIQDRYEKWRIGSKAKIYPTLKADCEAYMKLQEEQAELTDQSITGTVIKIGNSGYAIKIPRTMGEKYHHQLLELGVKDKQAPEP